MASKVSRSSGISYSSEDGVNMRLTEPVNGRWVYKQRVSDNRMVPVGALNEKNQLLMMFPPLGSEKVDNRVHRYYLYFYIDKEPKEIINFSDVVVRHDTEESLSHYVQIIDNLDEIQQITTSFEGKYYALGWVAFYSYEDPATVIFYDQYLD